MRSSRAAGLTSPSHERGHRRVTGNGLGSVAVQPRAAIPAAGRCLRPRYPAHRAPQVACPLLQQGGTALKHHQIRQRDMRPHLDRLPGPLGQQPGGDQPLARLMKSIVVTLRLA